MNSRVIHRRSLVILVMLVALLLPSPAIFARNDNPGVLPPNSSPHGKSYEEWSVAWWQWAISLPVTNHPLFDETGENCDVGQQGKVWFLGGVFNVSGTAVRDCTIPTGTALFFPILNAFTDNVPATYPNPETRGLDQQALIDECDAFVADPDNLAVTIDGQSLNNLENYSVDSTPFSYIMPVEDSLYDAFGIDYNEGAPPEAEPGPGAVSCGYYVMLPPLSKGEHTLRIQGTIAGGGFSLDVTYNLSVVPAGQYSGQPAQPAQHAAAAPDDGGNDEGKHKDKKRNGGKKSKSKGKHRR
jgi:hypothetical protein